MIFSKINFSIMLSLVIIFFHGCEKQNTETDKSHSDTNEETIKNLCLRENIAYFCYIMAHKYIKKDKVTNKKKFLKYSKKGCGMGMGESCYALGIYWEKEQKNNEKAFLYFKKGCAEKYKESCLSASASAYTIRKEQKKKNREHITFAAKACELGSSQGCFFAGHFLWYEKNIKDAAEYFSKGCSLSDSRSCADAALVHFDLGKKKKADSLIKKAISLGESAKVFSDIAKYMDKKGEIDKSYLFLEKAIKKDPEILSKIRKNDNFRKMRETTRYKKILRKILNKKKE